MAGWRGIKRCQNGMEARYRRWWGFYGRDEPKAARRAAAARQPAGGGEGPARGWIEAEVRAGVCSAAAALDVDYFCVSIPATILVGITRQWFWAPTSFAGRTGLGSLLTV